VKSLVRTTGLVVAGCGLVWVTVGMPTASAGSTSPHKIGSAGDGVFAPDSFSRPTSTNAGYGGSPENSGNSRNSGNYKSTGRPINSGNYSNVYGSTNSSNLVNSANTANGPLCINIRDKKVKKRC
jgi:hypothetical protein